MRSCTVAGGKGHLSVAGGAKRRAVGAIFAATCAALAVTSCTANPPPPIESTETPKTEPAVPTRNTIVVAIDEVGEGFNPHLLANQSPASAAVAALVLPSPFRPVVPENNASAWVPDNSVVVSAEVTSQEPFTITYQLRPEAQWSDGAPIAAEDFRYLWQQMINDPGVVDPAGYDLIADVNSSGGGKTVTVTMAAPYPAWRELFTDLVPSHLLKDALGGFERGLSDNIAVSGSRFHIKSVDRGRDEILLERNDRFWDEPAKPDQVLMRRGGSSAQLADSMRSNDVQVAEVHGGSATRAQLSAIPGVRTAVMAQPRVLQVALNARTGALADPRVRTALFGLLDPDLLTSVGADTAAAVQPARAQVLAPSDPGYAPTMPPRPTGQAAFDLLAESGFRADAPAPTTTAPTTPPSVSAPLARAGERLSVRIGAPQDDATALAVANTAADQWRGAGVDVTVREIAPDDLYGSELLEGKIDAVVGWVRAGGDPATALASRFGCPAPVAAGSASDDRAPADDTPTPAPNGATPNPTAPAAAGQSAKAPSNLSGICDPALQVGIDNALRGIGDVPAAIAAAEPALWRLAAVMPVLQDASVVAAGP
ncbi:ABC transporter family substrate-binding protein, partial [Aldersonia kunmingensis]|uniref:ABC transporter family substrate-binding protein n=1 Tax=Aldersonia kunmingensis TaxID=408066 RepID=UPI0009FF4152